MVSNFIKTISDVFENGNINTFKIFYFTAQSFYPYSNVFLNAFSNNTHTQNCLLKLIIKKKNHIKCVKEFVFKTSYSKFTVW